MNLQLPEVIPGILERNWDDIQHKLETVRPFAKTVHIDIIDGVFVDNKTFLDPEPFSEYKDIFLLELHMMVKNPIQYLEPFAKVGFKRFIGHIEMMPDQQEFVQEARKFGEAGLALDGPTELERLQIPAEELDSILVFTAERVGFSGATLLPERLDKIRTLAGSAPIEVDGGINAETILRARESGATRFAATSAIFRHSNPLEAFNTLTSLLRENPTR